MQPYPPLQTILAAAVLRKHGIQRRAVRSDARIAPRGRLSKPRSNVTAQPGGGLRGRFQFPVEDVSGAQSRAGVSDGASGAARRGIPIAVHGSDASDHVQRISARRIRCVLIGEVETTLLELAQGNPRACDSPAWLFVRSTAVRYNRAARAADRSGCAAAAGLGPGRHGSIPAGMDAGARLFFAEYGVQPRLPVPLQLVREADLRQQLSRALAAIAWRRKCCI